MGERTAVNDEPASEMRKRRLITGWRLFGLAVFALIVFAVADQMLVRSVPLRGYIPANSQWAVSSWDFPVAWRIIESGDVVRRMAEDWPRPHASLELAARLRTGVRPTASRWRVWLGKRMVTAGSPEGYGICTYPGYLLRWAAALRRSVSSPPDADGISQYGQWHYAWRDGYLIVSASRAFVLHALVDGDSPRLHSDGEALFTVQWMGEHEGYVHFRRGKGMPVEGQVRFACTDGERPLTLPQAWPTLPLATVTARDSKDLNTAWNLIDTACRKVQPYPELRRMFGFVADIWGVRGTVAPGGDHVSIALLDVNTTDTIPLPGVAVALRYAGAVPEPNPFPFDLSERTTLPFEWNGTSGVMAPLVGSEWSPCFARSSRDWVMTTREPLMADVAGRLAEGPACAPDVDVALRLSWRKLGETGEAIAGQLATSGLIPHMNSDDAGASITPKLKAIATLGNLALDGIARDGTLKFSGNLALPETENVQ